MFPLTPVGSPEGSNSESLESLVKQQVQEEAGGFIPVIRKKGRLVEEIRTWKEKAKGENGCIKENCFSVLAEENSEDQIQIENQERSNNKEEDKKESNKRNETQKKERGIQEKGEEKKYSRREGKEPAVEMDKEDTDEEMDMRHLEEKLKEARAKINAGIKIKEPGEETMHQAKMETLEDKAGETGEGIDKQAQKKQIHTQEADKGNFTEIIGMNTDTGLNQLIRTKEEKIDSREEEKNRPIRDRGTKISRPNENPKESNQGQRFKGPIEVHPSSFVRTRSLDEIYKLQNCIRDDIKETKINPIKSLGTDNKELK